MSDTIDLASVRYMRNAAKAGKGEHGKLPYEFCAVHWQDLDKNVLSAAAGVLRMRPENFDRWQYFDIHQADDWVQLYLGLYRLEEIGLVEALSALEPAAFDRILAEQAMPSPTAVFAHLVTAHIDGEFDLDKYKELIEENCFNPRQMRFQLHEAGWRTLHYRNQQDGRMMYINFYDEEGGSVTPYIAFE